MEGRNLESKSKSSFIAIPGSSNLNASDGIFIENSYKRSECVDNVEKALDDAFNEFHLESSCSESFTKSTVCFNEIEAEKLKLLTNISIDDTKPPLSMDKTTLNNNITSSNYDQLNATDFIKEEFKNQNTVFEMNMEDKNIENPVPPSSEKQATHNLSPLNNTNSSTPSHIEQTISHPLLESTETILNEKSHPNVTKSDMKLKLSNSNEYLQLIFSPSPVNENRNTENSGNSAFLIEENIFDQNKSKYPSNMLESVNNKTHDTNQFINIESEDFCGINENDDRNKKQNIDLSKKDNIVDEKLRHFSLENNGIKSIENVSRHSSDSSMLADEDDNGNKCSLKHEDPYEIINLTKELAIKKRKKQRLLSTTSMDSFSETLKDYVIPSIPHSDIVDSVENDAQESVKDTLKNALEEIEEGVDCTDAVEGMQVTVPEISKGQDRTVTNVEQTETFSALVPSVPCLGNMDSEPTEESENIYAPSVTDDNYDQVKDSSNVNMVFDVMRNENEFQPMSKQQRDYLYRNTELELMDQYLVEFIDHELNSGHVLKHPLFSLLTGYLTARKQVAVNAIQLEAFKADMKDFESKVWTFETAVLTESGECQDGNPVSASHTYRVCKFDDNMNSKLCRTLSCIQSLVTETYTNNVYLCQLDKLKIEDFLASVRDRFSELPPSCPQVALTDPTSLSPQINVAACHLRDAISVLFAIQRRYIEDAEFLTQSREWLERLVQILLRVATWRDHLFLLSHVMRCPSGIHSWAVQFIQAPSTPHNTGQSTVHINHMLTVLAIITSPVQQREAFLNATSHPDCNETWVIINDEEDDEEDELDIASFGLLKETDLIALLNQIPVDNLMRQLLCIRHDMHILLDQVSTESLLRLLAMSQHIINTLYSGITTYAKHKQFSKRLARLYIHIVEYLTDYLAYLIECNGEITNLDLRHVNIEYNAIIVQCVRHLTDINSNTWFFLPQIPFKLTNINICWTILNYLLRNIEGTKNCTLSDTTIDYLAQLNDELSIYLLNTVSNLITARNPNENMDLVYTIVQYILHIGYFESKLYVKYNKQCENLLVTIINERNHLITFIISEINNNMNRVHNENGKLLLYLFNYVKIYSYVPNKSDLSVLNNWLLNFHITNKLNNLSRFIISKFNYNELSHDLQVDISLLIASAWLKHTPDVSTNLSVTLLTDSMSYLIKPVNNEQIFNQWCWQIIFKLRLHLFDRPSSQEIRLHLNNLPAFLQSLPDLHSPSTTLCDENMKLLSNAVQSNQSLPCYIVLLVTNLGHSLPLINEKAWHMLNILINYYRYSSVINILQHILPLFVQNKDLLVNNYTFLNIVINLLNADRTYFKLAKNLIFSNFPGPVLKNLAHVIHFQLNNFHLYGLNSCHELIILWTDILCSVYKQDEMSCTYLLDCIAQYCVYDEPLKYRVKESFVRLINTMPTKNANTGISSLVSWVSSSNNIILNHTLLNRPLSHYANFEFFALLNLEIEEYLLQIKTNLWPQLLIELNNSSGKTNIDASLRRVCSSLKMNPLTSSHLSLYRYLYFILELPIASSHLSALFVQKFFALYLQRLNNVCVGHKFFEGISNNSLSKRLKAKLKEFASHYEKMVTDLRQYDDSEEDRLGFVSSLANLFRSYVLWLDEPRLLEPCLYLPALPPAYDPNRLAGLVQNTTSAVVVPYWYEFIDYKAIKLGHANALSELCATQNRAPVKKFSPVGGNKDVMSAKERIVKRLASYEAGKRLRKLAVKDNRMSTSVNKEAIINKEIMLQTLKTNFNQIVEYSEIYRMQIMENQALNEQLKSLLRTLYMDVNSEVVLNAACDVEASHDKHSSVYLNCAGPAVIRIQINESKLNTSVEHIIKENRVEYEGLLKRLMIAPPNNISLSTIYIHNFINVLIQEYNEVKSIGDYKLLQRIKESSICLFYEFLDIYIHHEYIYLPIVHIFNQYVDSLAQVFIRNTEDECYNLLKMILQHHDKLYEMLHKHFNPLHSSTRKYIEMYDLIVCINNLNEQKVPNIVLYNLLNKFNVNVWLSTKKPKLSERTQMINLIINALSNIQTSCLESSGGDTDLSHDKQCIHSTYRKQLVYFLNHDFPEHYGEILNLLLKYSETESMHCSIWYDFINVLLYGEAAVDNIVQGGTDGASQYVRPGLPVTLLRDLTRRYALEQHALSLYELQGTASLLSSHFTRERLQYGLYGLYPKYKNYREVIGIFLGLVAHALIVQTLYQCKGLVADKLSEQLCPTLVSVYSPWILPYLTFQLTEPTASWIQQLTDDRSILQPWVEADKTEASRMLLGFVETMKFMIEMLPASTNIYSFIWQFYTAHFTHSTMKEHVLCVVHSHLIHLQWGKFLPNLYDLELMLKLVDQYLPSCHTFLSQVFIQIQWNNVIQKYHQSDATSTKIHCTLLHLLIKLSNEPSIRQGNKITPLLLEAQSYAWHLIDAQWYEQVTNWFVMSYEPHVILQSNIAASGSHTSGSPATTLDLAALDLLQTAAGYVKQGVYHTSTSRKRQVFVRAWVRMTLQLATRYKNIIQSQQADVKQSICNMIDKVEVIIGSSVPTNLRVYESGLLVSELLTLLNQSSLLGSLSLEAFCDWLTNNSKASGGVVSGGLLKVSGAVVKNDQYLGQLLETCIIAWFRNTPPVVSSSEEGDPPPSPPSLPDWSKLLAIFQKVPPKSPPFEDTLVSHNYLVTLYTILVKNLSSTPSDVSQNAAILSRLMSYVTNIAPNEGLDGSKLPLLWMLFIQLCNTGCYQSNATAQSLTVLLSHLNSFYHYKQSWQLLQAIGIKKHTVVSNKCRLLCKFLIAYILVQMPERIEGEAAPSIASQYVRLTAGAPGHLSSTSSDLVPSSEALKAVSQLESLLTDKNYADLKSQIEFSLQCIRSPDNSLLNGDQFVIRLAKQLYSESYIQAVPLDSDNPSAV